MEFILINYFSYFVKPFLIILNTKKLTVMFFSEAQSFKRSLSSDGILTESMSSFATKPTIVLTVNYSGIKNN